MENSITKDKRLILKVNCSPMKLGGFSLTRFKVRNNQKVITVT